MFRAGGVIVISDGVFTYEGDTVKCNHCQRMAQRKSLPFVKGLVRNDDHADAPDDIGGVCGGCGKMICFECAGKGQCNPFLKQIERDEEKHYRAEQNRKMMGL